MNTPPMAPPPPAPPPLAPPPPSGFSALKSPVKMQDHVRQENVDFGEQLQNLIANEPGSHVVLYHEARPLLQDGPQCGLVATWIAYETLRRGPKTTKLEALQAEARRRRFSKNGEMFSASNLSQLVNSYFETMTSAVVPSTQLLMLNFVLDTLRQSLILVPYDCDFNQYPCLKKGHKAHWCVIIGVLVLGGEDESQTQLYEASRDHDQSFWNNIKASGRSYKFVVRQSKSLRLFLFDPNLLVESNRNLVEFAPSRKDDNLEYVLPEGGVKEGLAEKVVVISTKEQ